LHVASPFDIPLRLHWSFGGLVLVFAGWGGMQAGAAGVIAAVVAITMLAVSVVLHELGHALAAKHYGIGTQSITLYPFGGVAAIERMPEEPDQELVIALAGPAVNVLLAGFFGGAWLLTGWSLFGLMVTLNAGMGLFNLIPAFPMDGGRVLRALLARRMGFLPASRLAVRIGRVFAWLFIAVGVLRFWPSLLMVGIFLLAALHQEKERLVWMTWQRAHNRRPPWDPDVRYPLWRPVRPGPLPRQPSPPR
jgi:Zn-dependent protease